MKPIHLLPIRPAFFRPLVLATLLLTLGRITTFAVESSDLSDTNAYGATPPVITPAAGATIASKPMAFSVSPTSAEIALCRLFPEPLLPMGATPPDGGERVALAQALLGFHNDVNRENTAPLEGFLSAYPQSAYRVALLTNLGIMYRQHGYWSQALDAWQKAWADGKGETDSTKSLIVDRALGQLAELTARIGRVRELKSLLEEARSRNVRGPAAEKLAEARASLFLMENDPTKSFRCGPLAVGTVLQSLGADSALRDRVHDSVSTDHGTSLAMVSDFAHQLGLDYQLAFRSPGAAVLVPSVVNWKVGHFAALTRERAGRYVVKDPTFTDDFAVSQRALDAEASGYFLVRKGTLPSGWRSVSEEEAKNVWGKGGVSPNGPPPPPCQAPSIKPGCKQCQSHGMADYDVDPSRVNLTLTDTPLFYTPPRGPSIEFTASYSARDVAPSAVANYSNLGLQWNFGWVAFIIDDPNNTTTSSYGPGGGSLTYSGYTGDSNTGTFAAQASTQSVLQRASATSYVKIFPDGSRQIYGLADTSSPQRIFLTEYDDPAGNKLTYTYDSAYFRLLSVSDAMGQMTVLSYVSNNPTTTSGGQSSINPDYYRVSKVTDPFGRNASLVYDGNGNLSQITDMAGLVSQFTYDSGSIIALTTPYGTTTFAESDINGDRSLLITDPEGSKEKVEFKYNMTPPDTAAAVPTGLLTAKQYEIYRNSYYWDKKACAISPGDYSQAHLYHWLHSTGVAMGDILESEKPALESRIYYNYQGQTNAYLATNNLRTAKARVLDDGSTQLAQWDYNAQGKTLKAVTPSDSNTPARTTTYQYATNNIDLVAIYRQSGSGASTDGYGVKADLISSLTYDTQGKHLIVLAKDTAGQGTAFTYNTYGQVLTITDAKNETTTLTYDRNQAGVNGQTDGYLKTVQGPVSNSTTTYGYDAFGRVNQVTDSEGYIVGTTYDSVGGVAARTLNRIAGHSYPDGTFEEIDYDRLEPQWIRDRLGRWTQLLHDDLRRVTGVINPLGQFTQYQWCACGALEAIIDPMGRTTTWIRDVQGRTTAKIFPDNTVKTTGYETRTSRVKFVLDAKGQQANFTYNIDGTLNGVSYTDSSNHPLVPPTPSVSYTYEPTHGRVNTMSDGIGTTHYSYNPVSSTPMLGANRLASVSGPFDNSTIAFTYDELGRTVSQTINGNANATNFTYDSLGRIHTASNLLGAFTYNYVRNTDWLDNVVAPSGQLVQYTYFGGTNDPLLKTIKNSTSSGGLLSQFDYTYSRAGDFLSWTQNNPNVAHPRQYGFGYDAGSELTSATFVDVATSATLSAQAYTYDAGGNRSSVQAGNSVSTETSNNLNQLTSISGGGYMRFAGTVSKPATVTVNGNVATVRGDGTYEGWANIASTGTTRVPIVAVDGGGNRTDNYVDVSPDSITNQNFSYDPNGNQTASGPSGSQTTYNWDAADRLTTITQGSNVTRFGYDGQSRRVTESLNGVQTKRWVWLGSRLVEERDSNNNVIIRYFPDGEQVMGQSFYYTRDHLGSIRELTDGSQAVRARYEYDLYGKRSGNLITNNPVETSLGYTSHYLHTFSGLYFTPFRAYDPRLGRWLSRDLLSERDGPNLYTYVNNNPVAFFDPLGLKLCARHVKLTHFGDLASDKQGIRSHKMRKGEIAVGQTSQDRFIKGKTIADVEANQDKFMILKYGTTVTITPDGGKPSDYTVTDYGAFDKDHPEFGPSDWIDIWDPALSKKGDSGSGTIQVDTGPDCPCPPGYYDVMDFMFHAA